jgi:DNA-binding MarR family transcriptional regulator
MDDLSDADYQALAQFRHALRIFLRFSEEAARAEGLTPNQHQLLLVVRGWQGERPPTVADIAERLQLRSHSTLELARRAEEAGLVSLRSDPVDLRRQQVHLTPEGARALRRLSELHRDELRRFRTEMGRVLAELDHDEPA